MECVHSLVLEEGVYVCEKCGVMKDQYIDEGAEWRNYEDGKGEDQSRAGFATSDLLPESSYGSIVSHRGASKSEEFKMLHRISMWSMSSNSERSWMGIFDAIQMTCTFHNLPKAIVMDACGLYKKMEDAQKVRGETRRALMGAAVFVACRNNDASRTHEEIAKMFHVSIRTLCKAVARFSPVDNTVLQTQQGIAERLCTALKLNDDQRDQIFALLLEISTKSEDEFEHTPKTIVAGVTAHVMGFKTKAQMKTVSEASGVSALSIHKIVGKL